MRQCKPSILFLAGALMLGCPAWPVLATPVATDVILESRPALSAVDEEAIMFGSDQGEEDTGNGFMSEVDTTGIEVGAEAFTKKLLYQTHDKTESPAAHMPAEIQANGDTYALQSTGQPALISQEEVLPKSFAFESEVFTGEGPGHEPELIKMDENGITYRLVSKELNEQTAQARSEYKEIPVTYAAVEAGVQIPDEKELEIEDADTRQKIKAALNLKTTKVIREYWQDDFEFPITVTGYDADVFRLNGTEIPKDANLADYADEFLQYLKLDGTAYRISSIGWEGDAYQEGGAWIRHAVARGSKYVKDIEAAYAGEVKMPAIAGKTWSCVYEEEIPEDKKFVYTMAVIANYQMKNTTVVEKGPMEKIIDKTKGIVVAVYEAVLTSFAGHPVISSVPLVLLAAFMACFITKKVRNLCVYDDKAKCLYKKHNTGLCKTCVNYHRRNQV